MKNHLEDARVHCVVLKVRAVPSPATSTAGNRKGPEDGHRRSGIRSLRTQQRACTKPLTPSFPDPKAVLTRRSDPQHPIKCSTHELPAETFALIRVLEDRSLQMLLRKEVIQPHLPVRLPCYDLVLITDPTFDGSLQKVRPPASGVTDFHDLTGGVYKARERIHRSNADLRLLATPTSWGRVADPNPN